MKTGEDRESQFPPWWMNVGMEGLGIGMEVDQRLRGEEGVERHIFGHSRETGGNFLDLAKVRKMFHHRKETGESSLLVELSFLPV